MARLLRLLNFSFFFKKTPYNCVAIINKFRWSTNQNVQLNPWKYVRLSPLGTNLWCIYTYLDFHNINKVCWPNVSFFFVQSGHFGQVAWFFLKLFCHLFSSKKSVLIFWPDFEKTVEICISERPQFYFCLWKLSCSWNSPGLVRSGDNLIFSSVSWKDFSDQPLSFGPKLTLVH